MKSLQNLLLAGAIFACSISLQAQSPVITSWKINTTGQKISNGTDSILVDVEAIYYDSNNVYVKTSGIPDYYTFVNNNGNHNAASDLKALFKIPRVSKVNTGTPSSTLGGGQYGLYKDGTLLFNGEDARSYQTANIWHSMAYYFEGKDFDSSLGHSTPTYQYHHHVLDLAFQDLKKNNTHSPLIGFAFDGYPVYGPFGYADSSNMSSKIIRMVPGYQKRNITARTTLPDGTALSSSQYGPAINSTYPLGAYREDYIFVGGSGTLDSHNGRFTKTPEYPNGTYAYFATVDTNNTPAYPYVIGQTYYGVPAQGDFGPGGGKGTLPKGTVKYTVVTAINSETAPILSFYPNPATDNIHINIPGANSGYKIIVMDISGREMLVSNSYAGNTIDISSLKSGFYLLQVLNPENGTKWVGRLVKQ